MLALLSGGAVLLEKADAPLEAGHQLIEVLRTVAKRGQLRRVFADHRLVGVEDLANALGLQRRQQVGDLRAMAHDHHFGHWGNRHGSAFLQILDDLGDGGRNLLLHLVANCFRCCSAWVFKVLISLCARSGLLDGGVNGPPTVHLGLLLALATVLAALVGKGYGVGLGLLDDLVRSASVCLISLSVPCAVLPLFHPTGSRIASFIPSPQPKAREKTNPTCEIANPRQTRASMSKSCRSPPHSGHIQSLLLAAAELVHPFHQLLDPSQRRVELRSLGLQEVQSQLARRPLCPGRREPPRNSRRRRIASRTRRSSR